MERIPAHAKCSHGREYVYCRYLFPREVFDFQGDEQKRACIRSDPHRPDLRNFFLTRDDSLIINFEEHLLLMNLGNIDWRALINLWSVLDYLTKYDNKAGKGSKQLGKLFEDVLDNQQSIVAGASRGTAFIAFCANA